MSFGDCMMLIAAALAAGWAAGIGAAAYAVRYARYRGDERVEILVWGPLWRFRMKCSGPATKEGDA